MASSDDDSPPQGNSSSFGLDDILTRMADWKKNQRGSRPEDHPSRIGKYTVISFLGGGGQARAYRALHPELKRDVVIKLSNLSVQEHPPSLDRLQHEAQVLASLDHPHLVRVYDLSLHEGRPFLVLDHIEGRTLRQAAEERPLPPRPAASLVAAVARAIAYAHRKGMVHRDIKPDNVILSEKDRQPKVIDFGIAQWRDAWREDREDSGVISGTVGYMAPEQARGDSLAIGPRTDVFGLGSLLYFLLTGKPPYEAENHPAVIERARQCSFDRRALAAAKVPRQLEKICLRAMQREPQARFESAEQVAEQLEAFVRLPRVLAWGAGIAAFIIAATLALWYVQNAGIEKLAGAAALEPEMWLSISRGELGPFPIAGALPLQKGDRVAAGALLPIESLGTAAMFWYSSSGELRELSPGCLPAVRFATLNLSIPEADWRPGSRCEFIFICSGRGKKPSTAEIRGILASLGPLPELTPAAAVHVQADPTDGKQRASPPAPSPDGALPAARRLHRLLAAQLEWADGWLFRRPD